MQKIEAVIFDLGGVILDIDYNLTKKAFEKLGVQEFKEMYSQAEADHLFKDLETGNIKEMSFYEEFNKRLPIPLKNEEIRSAWNAMLLTFRENSLAFLNQIKNKYRLFLLSNTNEIHYNLFRKIYNEKERPFPFEDFFERAYYSFEMGKRKPDEDIFEHVLEANNLKPESTLFIDDSIQNINTAKALGLQTILLGTANYIENTGL